MDIVSFFENSIFYDWHTMSNNNNTKQYNVQQSIAKYRHRLSLFARPISKQNRLKMPQQIFDFFLRPPEFI